MTNNPVQIRPAQAEDAATLAQLGADTFAQTFAADNEPDNLQAYLAQAFSLARIREELADPLANFWLAWINGQPAGYAKVRGPSAADCVTGARPLELHRIYTLDFARGTGLGGALMQTCLEHARDHAFSTLWLGVWEQNTNAIEFYQYRGFNTVGTQKFHLGNDLQTDLIMQLEIT